MKIHISNYTKDLIPLSRWEHDYFTDKYGILYVEKDFSRFDKFLYSVIDKLYGSVGFINSHWKSIRNRKIRIKLDDFDTWNLDQTLAMIIVPALKQLKETTHGYPSDIAEAPEELSGEDKWNWVLDKMIWSFEQCLPDTEWESLYFTGDSDSDYVFTPVDKTGVEVEKESAKFYRMDRGPNFTMKFDKDGYNDHFNRIQEGLILFGKYYKNLWD